MSRDLLVDKADLFAHQVYTASRNFPKEESYGVTSQLRRAALSIILNLIEGFARNKRGEYIHFLEISYGSLKETKYLLYFSIKEKYMEENEYKNLILKSEEIGKMIWERMNRLKIQKRNNI